MSARLLLKHSTGLVVKCFQRTPGRSPASVIFGSAPLNCRPHTPATSLVSFRSFSVNQDKDTATEPIEENEEILRIREREARKDDSYKTETETGSTLDEPEPDFRDNVQASSEDIPSQSQESQQEQLDSDSEEALPLSPTTPSLAEETSRKATPQKNRENESIVEKLRKLSMLDISRHSEAEMDHDPEKKKDQPKYFDAKLIKVLNMKNRLKSRGDRDDDFGYRNNNYGRPNYNNRRGGVYDEDEDDYGSRGQSQRYSKGGYGGSSYGSNYNRQRNPRRNQFDDYGDDHYSDDGEGDMDFDQSRRPSRSNDSNSSRLQEQAQLRRGGGGIQRGLQQDDDEDDDDYENIVKNRYVKRHETSRARSGNDDQ